jgi:protocatechuate 3,4-dioxygenase beta subunit
VAILGAAVLIAIAVVQYRAGGAPGDTPLRGRVVVATDPGTPLGRARVELVSGGQVQAERYTDGDGGFTLDAATDASSRLRVSRAGFATWELDVAQIATRRPLVVPLPPGATLTGEVIGDAGDAAVVPLFLVGTPSGTPHPPVDRLLTTDDRGAFRFGSLPAGRYRVYLEAPVPADPDGSEPLHWGVRSPAAPIAELTLEAGEHRHLDPLQPRHASDSLALAFRPDAGVGEASGGDARRGTQGTIAGQVREPDGRPVAGASVLLEPSGEGRGQRAMTDAGGRYRFTNVQAGTYALIVVKAGYMAAQYGWRGVPSHGRMLLVRQGQPPIDADIVVPRAGVITGTVVDETGVPLEGLIVEALAVRVEQGRPTLVPAPAARGGTTDDRGQYRLHGLLPGTYYVTATDERAGLDGTLPRQVYHPGALSPGSAEPVAVAIGSGISRADLVFDTAVWTHLPRVTGRAIDETGDPMPGAVSLVARHQDGRVGPPARTATLDDDGRFAFGMVPAGDYVLHFVQAGLPAFPRASARAPITVGDTGVDWTLTANAGGTITGTIVLDGERGALAPSAFRLTAAPVTPDDAPAHPDLRPWALVTPDDVTFELGGLQGRMRIVPERVPSGWWLQSVMVGDVNAAVEPVEFGSELRQVEEVRATFSNRTGHAAGRVLDAAGRPSPDAVVVVFAADPSRWFPQSPFLRLDTTGPEGTFAVESLPPGAYRVAAIDDDLGMTAARDETWQQPAFLEDLVPHARSVTVRERQRTVVDVPLGPS